MYKRQVQGDPFASPSHLSVFVPHKTAGFDASLYGTDARKTALEDYLIRQFGKEAAHFNFQAKGSGKSGLISVTPVSYTHLRQVIHNCKGELLDIVSSTIPLLAGSEVVGAMTSTIFYDKYRAGKGLPKRRQGELYTLDDIISQDPIMIALKERCALIANNDSPVLLYGETGTGKRCV